MIGQFARMQTLPTLPTNSLGWCDKMPVAAGVKWANVIGNEFLQTGTTRNSTASDHYGELSMLAGLKD